MQYDTNQADNDLLKFKTSIEAQMAKIQADHLTFYELELAALDETAVTTQMTPALKFYRPYLRRLRKRKPHQLEENVERALAIREPWVSASPVVEYYEKQLALARFQLRGQTMGLEEVLKHLQSPDPVLRRDALRAVNVGLGDNLIHRFASMSMNVVAGSWHIESSERKYSTLRAQRNFDNEVPDVVVDSLLKAMRAKGVELATRYYRMKKTVLQKRQGLEKFTWADRLAPLPVKSGEKKYTWDEAVAIVGDGYKRFSSALYDLFVKQVDEERIHAPVGAGKKSGAYCDGVPVPA